MASLDSALIMAVVLRKDLTDEVFVEAWIKGCKEKSGLKKLAQDLGLEYAEASQFASRLRRAKVRLPSMPHPNQKSSSAGVNAEDLNKMIEKELGPQSSWRRYR